MKGKMLMNMTMPSHIKWFVTEKGIHLKDRTPVNCYLIDYQDDDILIDEWALWIRRNYIGDEQLLEDAEVNKMSVEEYLTKYVIPQKNDPLGPTARSADIGEIIVSDLLEFVYGFTVPRYKMKNRSGKCNSQQGTDVIGYKYYHADHSKSDKDELIAAEVKATLTYEDYSSISKAIKDSAKDEHRLARSIDYCRKRLRELGQTQESEEITRFLFKPDMDYKLIFAAAGISSKKYVDSEIELDEKDDGLEIRNGEMIFFIHGKKLMELTHKIYERCKK